MDTSNLIWMLAAGVALAVVALAVRVRTAGQYELKPMDLALMLTPLVLWLVATKQVTEVTAGGIGVTFAEAFLDASGESVEGQVDPVGTARTVAVNELVDSLEMGRKGAPEALQGLIARHTEAVEFALGHGGYHGPTIRTYFEALAAQDYLRFAIVYDGTGALFGVFDTRALLPWLTAGGDSRYKEFAAALNDGTPKGAKALAAMPGFLPGSDAVQPGTDKRAVLKTMEARKLGAIPVVDDRNRFVGMLNRDRLTASLIVEVSERLDAALGAADAKAGGT